MSRAASVGRASWRRVSTRAEAMPASWARPTSVSSRSPTMIVSPAGRPRGWPGWPPPCAATACPRSPRRGRRVQASIAASIAAQSGRPPSGVGQNGSGLVATIRAPCADRPEGGQQLGVVEGPVPRDDDDIDRVGRSSRSARSRPRAAAPRRAAPTTSRCEPRARARGGSAAARRLTRRRPRARRGCPAR